MVNTGHAAMNYRKSEFKVDNYLYDIIENLSISCEGMLHQNVSRIPNNGV